MRMLVGFCAVALLVAGSVFFPAARAEACSCVQPTPESLLQSADVVFVGLPVRLVLEAQGPFGTERLWQFDVAGVYKGEVTQGLGVSGGSGGDGGCEVPFTTGFGSYAIGARWTSGHLTTGICSILPASDFVAAMGSGEPPWMAGHGSGAIWVIPLAASVVVVILVAMCAWLVARRRSVAMAGGDR